MTLLQTPRRRIVRAVPFEFWLMIVAMAIGSLFLLTGCAWSDKELKDATNEVGFWGQMFGPQGVVASSVITAVMIAAVKAWRIWKGDPALTTMATGMAAAIEASKGGAPPETVAAILSQSIPGTTTSVNPEHAAAIVATAS